MNNPYKESILDNVSDFWERVKNLCRKNKITVNELSLKIGYSERTLIVKKSQNRMPNDEAIQKMAEIFNVSSDFLIYGNSVSESKGRFFVPVLNQKLSAGNGQPLPDNDEVVGYMEVPPYLRQYGKNLAILHVEGDSMEPTLRRGDMVACDTYGYDGEGIYAIQRDGDGYVKRIEKEGKYYLIISDNPVYPVKKEPVESDSLTIVGRVRCILKFV